MFQLKRSNSKSHHKYSKLAMHQKRLYKTNLKRNNSEHIGSDDEHVKLFNASGLNNDDFEDMDEDQQILFTQT